MKILNGAELAGFIKERQAYQVRGIIQSYGHTPKLCIILTTENIAIETYVRMKQQYGADIRVEVEVNRVAQSDILNVIHQKNADPSIHGIIIQLPLDDPSQTDEVCNAVLPEKDVDALGQNAIFDPATPMAILWLLAGYNIDLRGKNIVLVGRGKLVGAPLEKILRQGGHLVSVIDQKTTHPEAILSKADIVISAVGQPGIITAEMIKPNAVVIDAGVAGEHGKTIGDVAANVRERADLTLTPEKGGVGPLTICALFDNVIRAAREFSEKERLR